MSKMGSHDPFGHLQHKLWQKETMGVKIDSLTPDHKKLGIDRTFMRAGGMQHVIGHFRRKLQLCFRPHLDRRSEYEIIAPQNCESVNLRNFRTPLWESRDKKPFGCGPCGEV